MELGLRTNGKQLLCGIKKQGKPIYNAIVWQSRQTQEIVDELREAGHEKFIQEKTGLKLRSLLFGNESEMDS